MASVTTLAETKLVDGVGAITVTPVTGDAEGGFVREIRIVDTSLPQPIVLFILRVRGTEADFIELTTPSLTY